MDRQVRRHSQKLRQTWCTSRNLSFPPQAVLSIHPSRSLLTVSVRLLIMLGHMQVTSYCIIPVNLIESTRCIRRSVKKSEVN